MPWSSYNCKAYLESNQFQLFKSKSKELKSAMTGWYDAKKCYDNYKIPTEFLECELE